MRASTAKDILKLEIRRWARKHRHPYIVYKRLNRTFSPEVCPNASIDIFVTSWGRSANTYSAELVKHLYPDLRVASHAHSIASLKCAIRYRVRTLLLFRDPLNAISSFMLKQRDVLPADPYLAAHVVVRDYCEYHAFVLEKKDKFALVPFYLLTGNPVAISDAMATLDFGPTPAERTIAAHTSVMKRLQSDNRCPRIRQLSSAEKDAEKKKLHKHVTTDRNWLKARSVFKQLTTGCGDDN